MATFKTMLAILFLTVDSIPNARYWNRWRSHHKKHIRFYVNAKDPSMVVPNGFIRLPPRIEVRNTAWAAHTCVLAHQAMIQFALCDFPECKWFALVSGDSLPLKQPDIMFTILKSNTSMFGMFLTSSSVRQWATMNEAASRCTTSNWWVDEASVAAEDDMGSYKTIPLWLTQTAHANHILCRTHAKAFAQMPKCVPQDFDRLIEHIGGVGRFSLGADEVIPLNYLTWLQTKGKLGGKLALNRCVMYFKIDPDAPRHAAKLNRVPIRTRALFGRKFQCDMMHQYPEISIQ